MRTRILESTETNKPTCHLVQASGKIFYVVDAHQPENIGLEPEPGLGIPRLELHPGK